MLSQPGNITRLKPDEQYRAVVKWGIHPGTVIGFYPGGLICLKVWDAKKKKNVYRKILPQNLVRVDEKPVDHPDVT